MFGAGCSIPFSPEQFGKLCGPPARIIPGLLTYVGPSTIQTSDYVKPTPMVGRGAPDPLLILRHERDEALALAERSVSHGEAALKVRESATALLIVAYDKIAALEKRLAAAGEKATGSDAPENAVDTVIDQLDRRIVPERDRYRLRRHLDKADEPDRSRTGQDKALGSAIGRKPTAYGLRLP